MDDVERITVSLPVGEDMREAVAAGEYPSVEAVIGAAVDAWVGNRMIARIGVERLREHWDRGIASGDPQPMDFDALRAEIRKVGAARALAVGADD